MHQVDWRWSGLEKQMKWIGLEWIVVREGRKTPWIVKSDFKKIKRTGIAIKNLLTSFPNDRKRLWIVKSDFKKFTRTGIAIKNLLTGFPNDRNKLWVIKSDFKKFTRTVAIDDVLRTCPSPRGLSSAWAKRHRSRIGVEERREIGEKSCSKTHFFEKTHKTNFQKKKTSIFRKKKAPQGY